MRHTSLFFIWVQTSDIT